MVFNIIEWIILVLSGIYTLVNIYTIVTGVVLLDGRRHNRMPIQQIRFYAGVRAFFGLGIVFQALGFIGAVPEALQEIGWFMILICIAFNAYSRRSRRR